MEKRSTGRTFILVVEDDPGLVKMLTKMLEPFGRVTAANNGKDALASMAKEPLPDLVITDLMMPEMDGLTLAKKMKDDDRLSRVPVIMLTAKDGAGDVIAGINAGARAYLTKPFKHDELLGKVKKVLK